MADLIASLTSTVPWPVALTVALAAVAAGCWRRFLAHRENMKAIEKARDDRVPEVMRFISERGRLRSRGRRPLP